MSTNLSPVGGAAAQFLDNNGNPLSGGKIYTYEAGTTTPEPTYTTGTGAVAHTNPIILDSAGRVPGGQIWVNASQDYKFVLTTSADVTIATYDDLMGINGTGLATNAVNVAYDPAGLGAVQTNVQAKLRETVSVLDFGAVPGATDDSFVNALQTIIDNVCGQPESLTNPNPVRIIIPRGTYWLTKPVYIDALDGLVIEGDNLFGTTIKIPAGFTAGPGTVPSSFPSDGLDYATASCFVFARRRHTGKTSAFIVPGASAGAGAAWWYGFSNLYLDLSAYNTGKSADFIRAPEIANLMLRNIVVNGGRHVVNTDDNLGMYASVFENVKMFYGERFLKVERGTTLLMNQCAAVNCDYGFKSRVNYSVYNSCSVDNWGYGQYAWDLRGQGVVLNGCGCEYGFGGIFRAQTRGTDVVVNGGFFLGGTADGDPNDTGQATEADFGIPVGQMIYINGAKVSFNRTMLRNITEATPGTVVHLKGTVAGGGRVKVDGNSGENFNEYFQPEDWNQTGFGAGTAANDASRIDWTGDKPQFALYPTANITLARNGTPQITFAAYDKPYDLGPSYFTTTYGVYPRSGTVTEYRIPTPGIYEFTFNAFIDGVDPGDYLFFSVTGQSNRLMYLSDFPDDVNIGNQVTLTARYLCNVGDTVRIFYRSFSTTIDPVIKSAAFFGGMV